MSAPARSMVAGLRAGVMCAVVALGACSSPIPSAIVSPSENESPTSEAEAGGANADSSEARTAPETATAPESASSPEPQNEDQLPAFDNQPLTGGDGPAEGDHWHSPFGVMVCGEFDEEPLDRSGLGTGIHTHGDGLVHLHPQTRDVLGENATLAVFLAEVDIDVSNGVLRLPNGRSFRDGDTCGGVPAIVQLVVWDRHTNPVPTEVRTTDIVETRFLRDTQTFVLAFMPEGSVIPRPPSINTLSNWSGVT